jgi:two-component system sensor histidine kinase PilS (NtrC family)
MAGSIELLKGAAGLGGDQARLLDIALREAARLEQLVAAFLAFSRPAPPRRQEVAIHDVVSETLEVFSNDPAASRIRLERALEPAVAWCDPEQLRQVLWNLLANAAQAAGRDRDGRVQVSCGPDGCGARLVVEDDGPGISPEEMKQLFTPFFTTKEKGTGLGLALVQRIVDANGGAVEAGASRAGGAAFTVHLPGPPVPGGTLIARLPGSPAAVAK